MLDNENNKKLRFYFEFIPTIGMCRKADFNFSLFSLLEILGPAKGIRKTKYQAIKKFSMEINIHKKYDNRCPEQHKKSRFKCLFTFCFSLFFAFNQKRLDLK